MNRHPHPCVSSGGDPSDRTKRIGYSLIELLVMSGLILAVAALIVALMLPAVRTAGPAARRTQCRNNLHNIGLALHNYAEVYDTLPPAYTFDSDGSPLHSWRTLLLPYVDQAPLYATIDLTKPWDDPANERAREAVVDADSCPSTEAPRTHTTYLAIVAPGSCFRPTEPRSLSEITDEHGEALIVVEVDPAQAVHWMSPVDADEKLVLSFGSKSAPAHSGGRHMLCVDGRVQFISDDVPAAELQERISISANGGGIAGAAGLE